MWRPIAAAPPTCRPRNNPIIFNGLQDASHEVRGSPELGMVVAIIPVAAAKPPRHWKDAKEHQLERGNVLDAKSDAKEEEL